MLEGLDDATREWIKGDAYPPEDVSTALADTTWGPLVLTYADAHGDGEVRGAIRLLDSYHRRQDEPAALWEMYGSMGSVVDVKWPEPHHSNLVEAFEARSDEAEATWLEWFDEWIRYADGVAGRAYQAFLGEIERIKYGAGATFTVDQIDWDFVRRLNEYVLKNAEPGTKLDFLQLGEQVMILDDDATPPTYQDAFYEARAVLGSIDVRSRGGLTSRGRIVVTGASDEDAFEAHIRQFSKKSIEFA
ncbi:MAG: hypothetical protein ACRD0A_07560 [Acidimicrobiales bacterium]